jgi:phage terminase Nu1 subunit (DNA packaging protein)
MADAVPRIFESPGGVLIDAFHRNPEAFRALATLLAGDRTVKSLKEVAQWFGVSVATIKSGWRKAGDMPGREGNWPLREIVLWKLEREGATTRVDQEETELRSAGKDALSQKRVADARKAMAEASLKELKVRQLAGELVYRADIENEIAERIAVARHTLMRVPATLTPRFPKKLAQQLAEQVRIEIEHVLITLAEGATEE